MHISAGALRGQKRMSDSPRAQVSGGCYPTKIGARNQILSLLQKKYGVLNTDTFI